MPALEPVEYQVLSFPGLLFCLTLVLFCIFCVAGWGFKPDVAY